MKQILHFGLLLLLSAGAVRAQMPNDALYMGRNQICVATIYGRSTWNQYWEGSLKRPNYNIGTHTTQSVTVMPAIGIAKGLNVILSLPYITTQASAGNLRGQSGVQDLSAWLKYRLLNKNGFSLNAIVGASLPIGNYVPDFLPMSIGLQCRTATGRLLASYKHAPSGLYVTGYGSYGWRSTIRLDRDAYLADGQVYNTNQVNMPNVLDAGLRLGVVHKTWQAEVWGERFTCVHGDAIRRNDMPFPTNNMQATTVGFYGRIQPHQLGVNARAGYVVDGRNVGQSTNYSLGVIYQFAYRK